MKRLAWGMLAASAFACGGPSHDSAKGASPSPPKANLPASAPTVTLAAASPAAAGIPVEILSVDPAARTLTVRAADTGVGVGPGGTGVGEGAGTAAAAGAQSAGITLRMEGPAFDNAGDLKAGDRVMVSCGPGSSAASPQTVPGAGGVRTDPPAGIAGCGTVTAIQRMER